MRIAVIGSKGLPPKQGGIEHHCAEIYSRMASRGHSVDLFGRSSYTNLPPYHSYDFKGVQIISLPCLNVRGVDALTSSALAAITTVRSRYDVIHFHASGPALFSCLPQIASNFRWLTKSTVSPKIVVTCHGLDWRRAKWGNFSSRLIQLGELTAAQFADELIVVSQELQSYFLKTYGRRAVYIGNAPANYAASDASFAYGNSLGLRPKHYILFLGRLVPEKRPDLLVQAFQKLNPPGWKLVLVGGNSDTATFTSNLRELAEASPNILFTGELRGKRLAEIVRGAGLFVLPSSIEGLPLAMLEAMNEGIPVLASDIPVHRQLLSNERGKLFQEGNIEACVSSLSWAINHQHKLADMAKKAQLYVQTQHNWDTITSECLILYGDFSTVSTAIKE